MKYYDEHMTVEEAKDLFRQWRESNERKSADVMEVWMSCNFDLDKLGNEKHVIYEQVLYAALDMHQYGHAYFIIQLLSKEFPNSMRVMRYQAALFEAEEKYDDALEILGAIIKMDETNSAARKRRVAVFKAMGLITEAIKELVDYLKKFMSDVEAWQELCSLYLQTQEYSRAAFCAEETLLHQPHSHLLHQRLADIRYTMETMLHQPHSHLLHQRLADIRYTMGGVENMELAKTYYCQALKLNPENMRAMLGLFLTTNNLLSHYKSSGNSAKRKEAWRLCQWAQASAPRLQRAARPTHGKEDAKLTQMMLALAIAD